MTLLAKRRATGKGEAYPGSVRDWRVKGKRSKRVNLSPCKMKKNPKTEGRADNLFATNLKKRKKKEVLFIKETALWCSDREDSLDLGLLSTITSQNLPRKSNRGKRSPYKPIIGRK